MASKHMYIIKTKSEIYMYTYSVKKNPESNHEIKQIMSLTLTLGDCILNCNMTALFFVFDT